MHEAKGAITFASEGTRIAANGEHQAAFVTK